MGLAVLELIFFVLASIVLCFGFLTKALLIKNSVVTISEHCLYNTKVLGVFVWFRFMSFFSNLLPAMLRMQEKLGGDITLAADPNWWKRIFKAA